MVQRWAQERLIYHLTVINRSEKMMGDVNAITKRFGENVSVYLRVAKSLLKKDELKCPYSYDDTDFVRKGPTRLKICKENIYFPVLTLQCILDMSQPTNINIIVPPSKAPSSNIVTDPLMMHTTTSQSLKDFNNETTSFNQLEPVENLGVNWLCIDDVLVTSLLWSSTEATQKLKGSFDLPLMLINLIYHL